MNWYKRAQTAIIDTPTTSFIDPPDTGDDDDGDGYDWSPCYQAIRKWVVDNVNNDPVATIQKQLVEEIAMNSFQQGIFPEVMLWHDDIDFFKTPQHRAMTVTLRFAGFNGNPGGEDAEYLFFDMKPAQTQWQGLLQQSTLLATIQGAGCKISFIDEDLYEYVLGEICDAICYRSKQVAETFQTYLDNNVQNMQQEIISQISQGELSRFISPADFARIELGDEANVTNGGMHCKPSDFRFDTIGVVFTAEQTLYLDVPDDICERVLKEFGEEAEDELV